MIEYNVAGGKMNRGLTVLDVQQTFAKAQGKPLSNKVRWIFLLEIMKCVFCSKDKNELHSYYVVPSF